MQYDNRPPMTSDKDIWKGWVKESWQWTKDHERMILYGTTAVLLGKNRKLKKQNADMMKKLVQATELMNKAATHIERSNYFDTFFGPQKLRK